MAPAALLTPEKQRRLCLTVDHGGCATFVAARAVRAAPDRPSVARLDRPTSRPLARTAPLVLDHGRMAVSPRVAAFRFDRSIGQLALIALMVLAFAAILVARLAGGEPVGGVAGATGTPTPSSSIAVPSSSIAVPSTGTSPAPVEATATPTAEPGGVDATDVPSGSPTGSGTTYVVRSGDNLYDIATEFGTTWQVLAELNGIDDPGRMRVGQELRIP